MNILGDVNRHLIQAKYFRSPWARITDVYHIVDIDDDILAEAKFLNRGRYFRNPCLIPTQIARKGD